ncbi:helix-turn-helix transcriptional regulator [Mycoplasmatota bacterium]|nr:helix-turn-helix transcriptional regulator [Mycoplasmatota bacterium]
MKINVAEMIYQIQKKGEHIEEHPIGSRLKYKRKKLDLTLEESSENICSVSYLSKVENNLIKPTPKYINMLKKKYLMDDEEEINRTYDADLNEMMHVFFKQTTYQKKHEKPYEDYQQFMLSFGYFVLTNQFDKSHDLFFDIMLFIPNLPIKSLNFLLALTARVLFHDLRYSDAISLLQLMNTENQDIITILIQQKWLMRNAIKLNRYLLFEKIYPVYKEHLISQQLFNEIPLIKLERNLMYQSISLIQQYMKETDKIDKHMNFKTLLIKGFYETNQYEQVIKLTQNNLNHMSCLYYYILSIEKLNQISRLKKILSNISIDKNEYPEAYLIIKHFKFKYLASKEEQLKYLRNEILGYRHLTDEINVLYMIMMDAFNLFQDHHFYKEATRVINKFLPMMNQLSK